MQTILIFGAGKSSTFLIDYILESLNTKNRTLLLADLAVEHAAKKLKGKANTEAHGVDLKNTQELQSLIKRAEVVISMLPANLHPVIAEHCLTLKKHFFTASYESDKLRSIKDKIEDGDLLFLNECGLDPGIDHLSAMKIIHEEKAKGNEIVSFKSFCGGLLSLESENNPWKYKFTWNPRNVVLAGQGNSKYISEGIYKFVPYHQLFKRTEKVSFDNFGDFEGYANRDSLSYRKVYGLENIPTMLRGTLRREGFCRAWDFFVQLGMTDDTFDISLPSNYTNKDFLSNFLPEGAHKDLKLAIKKYFPEADNEILLKLDALGLFEDNMLPFEKATPAQILQYILENKWQLEPNDKDMIVMQHQFEIMEKGRMKKLTSSLICIGEDQEHTAMAKTVGLPLAIVVDLFLEGKIKLRGLQIPVMPEIYLPVLEKLEKLGIVFEEKIELS
jgi:saccharopine dehydrogenase-like NADP-dependent oxidoreductase